MLTLEYQILNCVRIEWFGLGGRSRLAGVMNQLEGIVGALLAQLVVGRHSERRCVSAGARSPNKFCSQASEGMWGMPGHTEAMKAVVSCDKLGGAAHTH